MTLGVAIIVVTVMYLIDKHGLWKQAAKLAAVAAVAFGLWFLAVAGYGHYQDWKLDQYTAKHVAMKQTLIANHGDNAKALCADPLYKQLTEGERQEVFTAVQSGDIFDRVAGLRVRYIISRG